jgi:hypothetical protein
LKDNTRHEYIKKEASRSKIDEKSLEEGMEHGALLQALLPLAKLSAKKNI